MYIAVWEKGKQAVKEQKIVKIGILEQKNLGITRLFLVKDLFKIHSEGTTNLYSFYVFIPSSPSTCNDVRYNLSLQTRSAVAQSFSFSASELRQGVGKLHGATHLQKDC